MSRADFHTHSTASDGRLTPTELIDLAAGRGVEIMALTDHDSIEGIEEATEAAAKRPGFTLIPGVEMSTDIPGAEVHVLGYFLNVGDSELQETLTRLRDSRVGRARRMVDKLRDLGVEVEWERVQAIAGDGAVGRPHVAQALLEKGHISTIAEAFEKYIGRNGPAYAEREKMTPVEVVTFLARKRYLPVLAHPADLDNLDELLSQLKAAGLVGMEVYYQDYDEATIERLLAYARRHDLLAMGGSDFHGLGNERERLPGDIPLPDSAIDAFLALAPAAFRTARSR
jgi:predicted metal-dependent phosphoesterase TrpH